MLVKLITGRKEGRRKGREEREGGRNESRSKAS